ncbi:unnamed protein product [Bubo scandiacus]
MSYFTEHFWGEKNHGFDVLYHNMKHGQISTKELADFVRERYWGGRGGHWWVGGGAVPGITGLHPPPPQLSPELPSRRTTPRPWSSCLRWPPTGRSWGTFAPLWEVFRISSDKLALCHLELMKKLHDLIKEISRYGEEQGRVHKKSKEEVSGTLEAVQLLHGVAQLLPKSKESYHSKCQEYERLRKEGTSQKEIDKAEVKSKKAGEALRRAVEKYNAARADFEQRMLDSAMRFQEVEEAHLPPHEGSHRLLLALRGGHPRPDRAGARRIQAKRGEHRHRDAATEVCREQGHGARAARSVGFRRVPPAPAQEGKAARRWMRTGSPCAPTSPAPKRRTTSAPPATPDYDEDEPRKFYVHIKPVQPREAAGSAEATMEQLKATVGNLILPPSIGGNRQATVVPARGISDPGPQRPGPPRGLWWQVRPCWGVLGMGGGWSQGCEGVPEKWGPAALQPSVCPPAGDGAGRGCPAAQVNSGPGKAPPEAVPPAALFGPPLESAFEAEDFPAPRAYVLTSSFLPLLLFLPGERGGLGFGLALAPRARTLPRLETLDPAAGGRRRAPSPSGVAHRTRPPPPPLPAARDPGAWAPRPPQPRRPPPPSPPASPSSAAPGPRGSGRTGGRLAPPSCMLSPPGPAQPPGRCHSWPPPRRSRTKRPAAGPAAGSNTDLSRSLSPLSLLELRPLALCHRPAWRAGDSSPSPSRLSVGPVTGSQAPWCWARRTRCPVATAFTEYVHAYFKGRDADSCLVKVTGELTMSFPAGIVRVFSGTMAPPVLSFRLLNAGAIEQFLPNTELLYSGPLPERPQHQGFLAEHGGADGAPAETSGSRVRPPPTTTWLYSSTSSRGWAPAQRRLRLCVRWDCSPGATRVSVDYGYNAGALALPVPLANVHVLLPVDEPAAAAARGQLESGGEEAALEAAGRPRCPGAGRLRPALGQLGAAQRAQQAQPRGGPVQQRGQHVVGCRGGAGERWVPHVAGQEEVCYRDLPGGVLSHLPPDPASRPWASPLVV